MKLSSAIIKELSTNLGFDACGISNVEIDNKVISFFDDWLNKGNNAQMHYLNKNIDIRRNPKLLLKDAKSVISLMLNYYSNETLTNPSIAISKYAYGTDYHIYIKEKLYALLGEIKKIQPEVNARVFVDTAPLLERYFAQKSGLGFIGKNKCLINKNFGSWVFLGEIIIDAELDYDTHINLNCANCNKCIKSCPTGALTADGIDTNMCISYHTIENKDEIPTEVKEKMTNQLFGCDICQDVCPFNKFAKAHNHDELRMLPQIKNIRFEDIDSMSDYEFEQLFSQTALSRVKREKLLNNFKITAKI